MVVRKSRNKVNTADILPVLSKHDRIFLVLPKRLFGKSAAGVVIGVSA